MAAPAFSRSICEGKRGYGSWARAEREAKATRRSDSKSRVGPYLCRTCGMFHNGNDKKFGMKNVKKGTRNGRTY